MERREAIGNSGENLNKLVSQKHQDEVRENMCQQYLRDELTDVTLIAGDDGKRFVYFQLNCISKIGLH